MSCYAPAWVKRDSARFPRARLRSGKAVEILSAFEPANWEADARAFGALMRHLRDVDAAHQTVALVQVENEVGMLGDAREWSARANDAFGERVPEELMARLRGAELVPELRALWENAGARKSGTWEETFGAGLATDEVFMAWHYARYVDRVAARGMSFGSRPGPIVGISRYTLIDSSGQMQPCRAFLSVIQLTATECTTRRNRGTETNSLPCRGSIDCF
jgi:beta-galactosidase GanA